MTDEPESNNEQSDAGTGDPEALAAAIRLLLGMDLPVSMAMYVWSLQLCIAHTLDV